MAKSAREKIKLEFIKFDPKARKHVLYKETKLK